MLTPDLPKRTIAIIFAALALVALLSLAFAVKSCGDSRTAKTQAKLSTGQAGAAIESGKDAANTIGNRMDTDAAGDAITRENSDAIHNAQGADAPVAPAVRDAGIASLCRRPSYQRDPRCVLKSRP